jgi:hypothetical protein
MARPTNKTQLLDKARKEYDKLETYLSNLAPEQIAAENAPQKSLRDILAHLYEWQSMFFGWYEGGLRGETPAVPATGYNWGQLPALNQVIYEKYKHLSLDETLLMFRASHQKTIKFIEGLSDEELTIPGLYPWMNRNTLLAYLNSTTGSHYVWAVKEAKKYT